MFVGVADTAVFASLTAAGLAWRREPNIHKQLMLLGPIGGLMWPAITRMPVIAGAAAESLDRYRDSGDVSGAHRHR